MESFFDDYRVVASTDVLGNEGDPLGCIRELEVSPDESYVLVSDSTRSLRSYFISYDMLEQPSEGHLPSQSTFRFPAPPTCFAISPYFDPESDPNSAQFVVGMNNQLPIRTMNILTNNTSGTRSYHAVNDFDKWFQICSLKYTTCGTKFLLGSDAKLCIFDTMRSQLKPYTTLETRRFSRGHGFKGYISAMDICPATSVLALGTSQTRHVALFSNEGLSGLKRGHVTDFALPSHTTAPFNAPYKTGTGITQVKFSPDGQYLYIAERCSDIILIYDIRSMRTELGYCDMRNAVTNQKIGFDVRDCGGGGHEVWSGGLAGDVKVWRNPHQKEGAVFFEDWVQVGRRPVVGVKMVESGDYFVTAEGGMEVLGEDGEDGGESGEGSSEEDGTEDEDGSIESEASSEEEREVRRSSAGVITGSVNRPQVRSEGCVKVWSRYTPVRPEDMEE